MLRWRRRKKEAACLLLLSALACSGRRPPSPMKDEPIRSAKTLVIGLFDFGAEFDRGPLRACPNDLGQVRIVEEREIHRQLKGLGLAPEDLLEWGETFDRFRTLKGIQLLLLAFRSGPTSYLRAVNYLGQYVTTVVLDVRAPTCRDILRGQRLVLLDSDPTLADLKIDDRLVGEAPLWAWLKDGEYRVTCTLPEQAFSPAEFRVPRDTSVVCTRAHAEMKGSAPADAENEKMSAEEKGGAVLVWIVGVAATLAAIIVPLLLFL